MKLLTATREGQGVRDGDFCDALEGELVTMGWATDQHDPLGGSGRGLAFSGLSSRRATTTALVRDLDLSYEDVELAVATQFDADGFSPEVMGDLEYAYLFVDTVEEMIRFGAIWPVGTVVRRMVDGVTIR